MDVATQQRAAQRIGFSINKAHHTISQQHTLVLRSRSSSGTPLPNHICIAICRMLSAQAVESGLRLVNLEQHCRRFRLRSLFLSSLAFKTLTSAALRSWDSLCGPWPLRMMWCSLQTPAKKSLTSTLKGSSPTSLRNKVLPKDHRSGAQEMPRPRQASST